MKFEHLGLNVSDPVAVAQWYVEHIGLTIVKKSDTGAKTHFLADPSGVMLEVYNNPPEAVPDYATMNPLLLHVALTSENPTADKDRLVAAGATVVEEIHLDDGSHLFMMRDPWGLAIQLCKRGKPMVAGAK